MTPTWLPLENFIDTYNQGKVLKLLIDDFMFMGTYAINEQGTILPNNPTTSILVHTYKHRDTRNYLNLDDESRTYQYQYGVSESTYLPITANQAIEKVMR